MPELPEVEYARALIEERGLGRRIAAVDDRDTWVCRPHAPGEIHGALAGLELTAARRIGKTMWCETDGGVRLGLHLGMTGRILIDDDWAGDPQSPGTDREDQRFHRFAMTFEDGGRLALFDKRRLGRAVLDPPLDDLGPDAAAIGKRAFRERVGRGAAPLKARIMDQSVIAGVGNLLADELLWRARLSPVRPAADLAEEELDRLHKETRATVRAAIRKGGSHTGRFMPARVRGGTCPRCGTELARDTVGGRTTFWCPAEQT